MERHYENIQLKNLQPELVEVRKKKLEQADFQTYDLELGWSSGLEVIEESPLETDKIVCKADGLRSRCVHLVVVFIHVDTWYSNDFI